MVLLDSNVHLDLLTFDPIWYSWSQQKIAEARNKGPLIINPIIYAEISNAFGDEAALNNYVNPVDFMRHPLPWEAAFIAGRAFRLYRQRGGHKSSPLPDFYIGAHAQVSGFTLITRDKSRYETYFPQVKLITP